MNRMVLSFFPQVFPVVTVCNLFSERKNLLKISEFISIKKPFVSNCLLKVFIYIELDGTSKVNLSKKIKTPLRQIQYVCYIAKNILNIK